MYNIKDLWQKTQCVTAWLKSHPTATWYHVFLIGYLLVFIFVAVYFLVLSLVNDVVATSKRCVKLLAIIFILEILFLFLYCFTYVLIDIIPIKYITIRHHVRWVQWLGKILMMNSIIYSRITNNTSIITSPGGYSWEFLVGVFRPVL